MAGFIRKKLVKVYRNKNLIINVSGRGDKDVAAIADYLEAKKQQMEKLQSFLSQRACGCWKQAEKAVRLGPSETREENIILKGVPFIAQPVTGNI